ncbi:hypothetical protein ACFXOI_32595 [Streptomyces bacillaris]|uniref:hypothetical protein n=1 Tax=Streptomyces TaxID=1883 RepID=UPI00200D43A4|nr:hypothetical protein [Streptomyces sp. HNA39]UQA32357.1 hypothetical protein KRR37_00255 [Streptomyces sp. HNA39]
MARYNKRIDPVGDNGLTRTQQAVARRWGEVLEQLPRLADAVEKGTSRPWPTRASAWPTSSTICGATHGQPTRLLDWRMARCSTQWPPTRSTHLWAGHSTQSTAPATELETTRGPRRSPRRVLPEFEELEPEDET